jgi:hypothetical protein
MFSPRQRRHVTAQEWRFPALMRTIRQGSWTIPAWRCATYLTRFVANLEILLFALLYILKGQRVILPPYFRKRPIRNVTPAFQVDRGVIAQPRAT